MWSGSCALPGPQRRSRSRIVSLSRGLGIAPGSERKTNFKPGNTMSQNLNLLRQNYCRSATVDGKGTPHLFALERECAQGKALLAKAPKTLLQLQKFNPHGL